MEGLDRVGHGHHFCWGRFMAFLFLASLIIRWSLVVSFGLKKRWKGSPSYRHTPYLGTYLPQISYIPQPRRRPPRGEARL